MKYYYPYKSDKPEKKYFIMTKTGKHIYFGAAGMSDFTKHKDEDRKNRYIDRHKHNEDWGKSGIDTVGVAGSYGINQPLEKVIKILKKDF